MSILQTGSQVWNILRSRRRLADRLYWSCNFLEVDEDDDDVEGYIVTSLLPIVTRWRP